MLAGAVLSGAMRVMGRDAGAPAAAQEGGPGVVKAVAGAVKPRDVGILSPRLSHLMDFAQRVKTAYQGATADPESAAPPEPTAPTEVMPRGTPPAPGKSPQAILNEQAIQARRDLLVSKGASPQQAAAAVPSAASAPTVDPAPGPASAPAPAQSPPPGSAPVQRAMEHPTVDELEQFQRLLDRGMSKADARRQIEVMRELIAKTGASTDAQLRAEMARLAVSGQKSLMPIYGPKTP